MLCNIGPVVSTAVSCTSDFVKRVDLMFSVLITLFFLSSFEIKFETNASFLSDLMILPFNLISQLTNNLWA